MNSKGLGYALAAYGAWGLLPIYWKLLQEVPAFEILLHRMVWSLLFLVVVVHAAGRPYDYRAGSRGRFRAKWGSSSM